MAAQCKLWSIIPLMLSACAPYAPDDRLLGQDRTWVIQALGAPSNELDFPVGRIMMYPKGPFGKHTYFVYLDKKNTVSRWTQVLDEKYFVQIKPGMSQDEVVEKIGISKDRFELARNRGYVWNYRYVNPHCFWFQIEFASDNTVRSSGYSRPPECRTKLGF